MKNTNNNLMFKSSNDQEALKKLQKEVFNIAQMMQYVLKEQNNIKITEDQILSSMISNAHDYDKKRSDAEDTMFMVSLIAFTFIIGMFTFAPVIVIIPTLLLFIPLLLQGYKDLKLQKPAIVKSAENNVINKIAEVVENTIISHDTHNTQNLQKALNEKGILITYKQAEIIVEAYKKDNYALEIQYDLSKKPSQQKLTNQTQYSIHNNKIETDSSTTDKNLTNTNLEAVKKLHVVKQIAKDITRTHVIEK
jgi:hypothetical protein